MTLEYDPTDTQLARAVGADVPMETFAGAGRPGGYEAGSVPNALDAGALGAPSGLALGRGRSKGLPVAIAGCWHRLQLRVCLGKASLRDRSRGFACRSIVAEGNQPCQTTAGQVLRPLAGQVLRLHQLERREEFIDQQWLQDHIRSEVNSVRVQVLSAGVLCRHRVCYAQRCTYFGSRASTQTHT